jgi:hypothetical protein
MYSVYTFIACPLSALDSVVHLLAFDVPGFPIGKARKKGQKMQRSIAAFFGQRAGEVGCFWFGVYKNDLTTFLTNHHD